MDSSYDLNKVKSFFASPVLQLSVIYCLFAIILGFAYAASRMLNVPFEHLTADPAMIYEAHPFTGLISNFGALLWCFTAAVCLFSYMVLRKHTNTKTVHFLLFSGLITFMLCLDDLFMLHEAVFPWHLRIPQKLVYIIYILITGSYLLYFLKHILQSEYVILVVALLFLGFSLVGDIVLPQEGFAYFVEDALKLFGIGTWFLYYFRYSLQEFDLLQQAQFE